MAKSQSKVWVVVERQAYKLTPIPLVFTRKVDAEKYVEDNQAWSKDHTIHQVAIHYGTRN